MHLCLNGAGFAFGTGLDESRYWLQRTKRSLRNVRTTHSNTLQISAYLDQIGLNSVRGMPSTRERAMVYMIRQARRAGYKVFLKPTVYVTTKGGAYRWRGLIRPRWIWFKRLYLPYIVRMARIAQRERVEILAVGSEYSRTLFAANMWRHTIRQVRNVYKGKLTYIANHDTYDRVRFWNMLDFVSVAAYFILIPKKQYYVPNLKQSVKLFEKKAQKMDRFLRREKLEHKGVLIAEVGFQSKGGTLNYKTPWDWDGKGAINYYAQKKMYIAFTRVFMSRPWNIGAIFWHWDLDPNAGSTHSRALYTPQDKPALEVIKKRFRTQCK